jgi:hypothetical protein
MRAFFDTTCCSANCLLYRGKFVIAAAMMLVVTGTFEAPPAASGQEINGGRKPSAADSAPSSSRRIAIDASWLAQRGAGSYVLDSPRTIYTLATDVTTPGTAFVVGAPHVTLNLNGHTVTYGNASPIIVTNGGFEEGAGRVVPGWDISGASAAALAPNTGYLWGKQVLQLANFTTPQRITSAPIRIPLAHRSYAATITPAHSSTVPKVSLTVVDSVTGQALGKDVSKAADRGFSAVVRFVPSTTHPVCLQVDVEPNTGAKDTIDLDYASLGYSDDYGILASFQWSGQLPGFVNLSADAQKKYRAAADFTIRNGNIRQGQAHGYASDPLFMQCLAGLSIDNIRTDASGVDVTSVDANSASGSIVIRNSVFNENIDNITDRMHGGETISLNHSNGPVLLDRNQLIGSPHVGIGLTLNNPKHKAVVSNNVIRQRAVVANAYGIAVAGVQNFEILNNAIEPTNGRGILVDGWSSTPVQNGRIEGNRVSVREGYNREYYTANGTEARALRLRNNVDSMGAHRNLTIRDNTFIATTGPGLAREAYGVRINYVNPTGRMNDSNVRLENNIIKAVVTSDDPSFHASALDVDGMDKGICMKIANNALESNDVSLQVAGNDGNGVRDVVLFKNTLRRSRQNPERTYRAVLAGYWVSPISGVRLVDTKLEGGAGLRITWSGQGVKELSICRSLDVKVVDPRGNAASEVDIVVANRNGDQVCQDRTMKDGRTHELIVPETVWRQATEDSTRITKEEPGPFKVTVKSGSFVTTKAMAPLRDHPIVVTIGADGSLAVPVTRPEQ